jgi:hypothetical protein
VRSRRTTSAGLDVSIQNLRAPLIAPVGFRKLRRIRSLNKGTKGIETINSLEIREFCGAALLSN